MNERTRMEALEAALAKLDRKQQSTEGALRRWRHGVMGAVVAVGCIALPQLAPKSFAADTAASVNARLKKLEKDVRALKTALAAETTARTAADATLTTNLAAETKARAGADATLTTNLNNEVAARTAAVTVVSNNLTTETSARIAGDNMLSGDLATEIGARTAADATLTTNLNNEVAARIAAVTVVSNDLTTETNARIAGDNTLSGDLATEIGARTAADAAINNTIGPFFARVYVDNGVGTNTEIVIHGANLHVVNDLGATNGRKERPDTTNGVVNGLGNLIIGYNELQSVWGGTDTPRTGSHNLVVGSSHTYTSFGGILLGLRNITRGPFASVTGGYGTIAEGLVSGVHGGTRNTATLEGVSILGGVDKTVDTPYGTSP